jgi:hypothetical protein
VAFVVLLTHHVCAQRQEVPSWHPRRFGPGKGVNPGEGASVVRAAARPAHDTGEKSSGYTAGDARVAVWLACAHTYTRGQSADAAE